MRNTTTSYNSCCAGNFQNDYVDLDPLKEVIFQGARVLDFEIYKVNGDIVVGAGSTNNMCMKGTYNVLSLGGSASSGGVLKNINNWAFSRGSCPSTECWVDNLSISIGTRSRSAIFVYICTFAKRRDATFWNSVVVVSAGDG